MYKLFKITYNDGGWHSGPLPYFYYIGQTEDDIIFDSKQYQQFLKMKQCNGGDIWIHEINEFVGISGFAYNHEFENLDDFEISISLKKKDEDK